MTHLIDLNFLDTPHAIATFLVETSIGPVLIETGPHSTFPRLKKNIEDLGYSISDIQHVFLSHIHFDHAGAAWAFAELGANIYLHPVGAFHMEDPSRLVESARRIYKDQMDYLWGQLKPIHKKQLILCEHEQEMVIGDKTFTSWHTPGHAIHHIAWQVGAELFAGDVAGVCIDKGMVVPPCPPPDINLEDWMESIQLIRSLPLETIWITHYGKVENIAEHLDQLAFCLKDWANWMKPYALENANKKEVAPKFQEYVAQQLAGYGITEEVIKKYETANPSWMSVAGLMRYWQKLYEEENS